MSKGQKIALVGGLALLTLGLSQRNKKVGKEEEQIGKELIKDALE